MAELVAKTYAGALYEVGIECGLMEQYAQELSFVRKTFEEYPQLLELCKTPQINKNEKKEIIEKIFKESIHVEVLNFIKILLDKKRMDDFESIQKSYQQLVNDYNNIVEGVAITAIKLKENELKKIEKKLSDLAGKNVKLINEIDPSIIGGVRVRIGEKVLDSTIQSRLNKLREELAQIIV
ncbi:F0F1 ATP synthase subunit delta [Lutibacter sp. B2]|nr:F0F1 ATP synthase subunit delta [Lutibacter sp. B2]